MPNFKANELLFSIFRGSQFILFNVTYGLNTFNELKSFTHKESQTLYTCCYYIYDSSISLAVRAFSSCLCTPFDINLVLFDHFLVSCSSCTFPSRDLSSSVSSRSSSFFSQKMAFQYSNLKSMGMTQFLSLDSHEFQGLHWTELQDKANLGLLFRILQGKVEGPMGCTLIWRLKWKSISRRWGSSEICQCPIITYFNLYIYKSVVYNIYSMYITYNV